MSEQLPSPLLVAVARWYRRTTVVIAALTGWPCGEFRIHFLSTIQT